MGRFLAVLVLIAESIMLQASAFQHPPIVSLGASHPSVALSSLASSTSSSTLRSQSAHDAASSTLRRRVIGAVPSVFLPPANAATSDGGGAPAQPPPPSASPALRGAIQRLWDLDAPSRLTPGNEYEIDVQGGKRPYGKPPDAAPCPLFVRVDPDVFRRRSTYRAFVALLDNYVAEVNTTEVVSAEEEVETRTFIDAVMHTEPMRFCHAFCRSERPERIPSDPAEFADLLHKLWFKQYKRTKGGATDSCGFEHVFVGETKNEGREVTGFHNWIRFFLEERRGTLDYRGYIKPKNDYDVVTDGNDQVLTLQFLWRGAEKLVGTSFIGVSPEFEMALYTTCFLVGQQQNLVQLKTCTDTFDLNVKCFPIAKGSDLVCPSNKLPPINLAARTDQENGLPVHQLLSSSFKCLEIPFL